MFSYLLKFGDYGSKMNEQRGSYGDTLMPHFGSALIKKVNPCELEVSDEAFVASEFTVGQVVDLGAPQTISHMLVGEFSGVPLDAKLSPLLASMISALLYSRDTIIDSGQLICPLTGYGDFCRSNTNVILLFAWLCGVLIKWKLSDVAEKEEKSGTSSKEIEVGATPKHKVAREGKKKIGIEPSGDQRQKTKRHFACCCMDTPWDIISVLNHKVKVSTGPDAVEYRKVEDIMKGCGLHLKSLKQSNLFVLYLSDMDIGEVESRSSRSFGGNTDTLIECPNLRVGIENPTNIMFLDVHKPTNIDKLNPSSVLMFVNIGSETRKAVPVADFLRITVKEERDTILKFEHQPEILEVSNPSIDTALKEILAARDIKAPYQVITQFTDKARKFLLLKYQDHSLPPIIISPNEERGNQHELPSIMEKNLPFVIVSRHCVSLPCNAHCIIVLDGSSDITDSLIDEFERSRRLFTNTTILYSDHDTINGNLRKVVSAVAAIGYKVDETLLDSKMSVKLLSKKKHLEAKQKEAKDKPTSTKRRSTSTSGPSLRPEIRKK